MNVLPQAPSRINRPETFVTDSSLFLDALPQFADAVNTLVGDINDECINRWNMGDVSVTIPQSVELRPYTVPSGSGLQYVDGVDSLYLTMYNNQPLYDAVVAWIDQVKTIQGVVPSNGTLPEISLLTQPQRRSQQPDEFNQTAITFTQSNLDNVIALREYTDRVNEIMSEVIDCGGIVETVTETIDCGSITDSHVTN